MPNLALTDYFFSGGSSILEVYKFENSDHLFAEGIYARGVPPRLHVSAPLPSFKLPPKVGNLKSHPFYASNYYCSLAFVKSYPNLRGRSRYVQPLELLALIVDGLVQSPTGIACVPFKSFLALAGRRSESDSSTNIRLETALCLITLLQFSGTVRMEPKLWHPVRYTGHRVRTNGGKGRSADSRG